MVVQPNGQENATIYLKTRGIAICSLFKLSANQAAIENHPARPQTEWKTFKKAYSNIATQFSEYLREMALATQLFNFCYRRQLEANCCWILIRSGVNTNGLQMYVYLNLHVEGLTLRKYAFDNCVCRITVHLVVTEQRYADMRRNNLSCIITRQMHSHHVINLCEWSPKQQ